MLFEDTIKVKTLENSILIEVPVFLNFIPTKDFLAQIGKIYESKFYSEIIINIEKKTTLSSVGYGFIMSISKLCVQKNVRLKLICRNEKVLDLIEILKIGKLFQIFPTLEEALKN